MRSWLKNQRHNSDFLMFHHRYPTSTVNVRKTAHPFHTGTYFDTDTQKIRYVLVHNGHVSNNRSLREAHEKLGITYSSILHDDTFNDSESLLWDVALTMEGKQDKLQAYGGIAFVAAKVVDDEITQLFFARNTGRPLNLFRSQHGLLLSSEGLGEAIEEHQLYTYNYALNRLTKRYFRVPAYQTYASSYQPSWNSNTYHPPAATPIPSALPFAHDDSDDYGRESGVKTYFGSNFSHLGRTGKYYNYDEDQLELNEIDMAASFEDEETEYQSQKYDQLWYLEDYVGVKDDEVRVKDLYDAYMTHANGIFNDAYDLVDSDYSYFSCHQPTVLRNQILNLISRCMEMICYRQGDEEYNVDENYFVPVKPSKMSASARLSLLGAGQEG